MKIEDDEERRNKYLYNCFYLNDKFLTNQYTRLVYVDIKEVKNY